MPKKSCRVVTFISMRFMKNEVPLSERQKQWVPFQSIRVEDAAASALERKMVLDLGVDFRSHLMQKNQKDIIEGERVAHLYPTRLKPCP